MTTGKNHPRCCPIGKQKAGEPMHVADAMCCGAMMSGTASRRSLKSTDQDRTVSGASHSSAGRSEPAAASATTTTAAEARPPIQTARPIISSSDAKAVNQVRPASGFPAADPRHRGRGSRAEVPKVIIGNALRRSGLAEKRVLRRHAAPDHLVDHRDLRMIEDRRSQGDAFGGGLREIASIAPCQQRSTSPRRPRALQAAPSEPWSEASKARRARRQKSRRCDQQVTAHSDHPDSGSAIVLWIAQPSPGRQPKRRWRHMRAASGRPIKVQIAVIAAAQSKVFRAGHPRTI